jgi:hypothetical protein
LHGVQLGPQAFLFESLDAGQLDESTLPLTHFCWARPQVFGQSGRFFTSSTLPLQSLSRPSHTSSETADIGLQPPSQATKPAAQAPLHTASIAMHCWPHLRNPSLHRKPHEEPSQVATPLPGAEQGEHASAPLPHEAMLLLSLQSLPHLWNPGWHWNAQAPPVHMVSALGDALHGWQVGPQKLTSSTATQLPLQFCFPAGHTLLHAIPMAMHLPAQIWVPPGHSLPQLIPSQVALPPVGTGHGALHEPPQLATSVSETQASAQR